MPDMAMELDHLALSDKHIADSKRHIAEAEAREADGPNTDLFADLLKTMKESLAAHEGHRELILRNIAAMTRGDLPAT